MTLVGWNLVYIALFAQLVATFVLLAPLPTPLFFLRRAMIKGVNRLRNALFVIAGISALLAFQSYLSFSDKQLGIQKGAPLNSNNFETMILHQTKVFRNQRNFYMSIMSFTLAIVLVRLAAIYQDNLDLHARVKEAKMVRGETTSPTTTTTITSSPAASPTTPASTKKNN